MVTLDEILAMQADINKNIRKLNSGGCIHFAYYCSKALKTADIPHKILFCNQYPVSIKYDSFSSVSHVLVHIIGLGYIDGYDFYDTKRDYLDRWYDEKYASSYSLSIRKLDNFRNNYRWNPQYKVRQNLKLERIINKHINGKRRNLHKGE